MKTTLPLLIFAALLSAACHPSGDADRSEQAPPPIEATTITTGAVVLNVYEEVVGTVQPKLQATVSSKAIGRIIEMHAVPGKAVKKGDLLAMIESPTLAAALARADAALANAESEAKRYRTLRDSGSVSQSEIDRVETALRMVTAERDQIRSQLDETSIVAPFSGRITSKERDTGDLVQPGTAVCRIEDPKRLRFDMHVAETLANRLKIGDRFRVVIQSAEFDVECPVSEISPAADTGSRTFLVKLDLPAESSLLAGQFGRAFLPRTTRSAIVVPEPAILRRGQLAYVATIDADHIAHLRIVRTGSRQSGGIEILAGLEDGERFLAEIPGNFSSGTPVKSAE